MKKQCIFLLMAIIMAISGFAQTHVTTFPYSQTFEDTTNVGEWSFKSTTSTQGWFIGAATGNTGNSMYISNDNGVTNAYTNTVTNKSAAYITVEFGSAGEYDLSFDWKAQGESVNYDKCQVYALSDTSTLSSWLSSMTYTMTAPSNGVALATNLNLQGSTWQHKTIILSGSTYSNTTKTIVFVWYNDGSVGNNPPAAIDNVSIVENSCAQPSNLAVDSSSITTTGATVSWHENGTATAWELYYKVSDSTAWDSVSVSDSTYTFSTLTANTLYNVYVKSDCGSETSVQTATISFRTACADMTIPYTETFDSYSSGSFMPCWSRINTYTYGTYPQVNSYYSHSGNSLSFYASNGYNIAVAPMVVDTITNPISSLSVAFYYTGSTYSSGKLIVGVMTNPSQASTFVPVDTLMTNIETWTHREISLINYTGQGQYIALKYVDGSYNVYVDDFSIFATPTCPNAYSLVSTNVTNNSITLSWDTTNSVGQGWNVSYAVYDSTVTFDPANGTIVNVTGNPPYVLTGLTTATTYQIALQQACGGNWSNIITANTMGEPTTIPYTCDFEDQAERSAWYLSNSTAANRWFIGNVITANDSTDTISGYSLYVSNDNGVTNVYDNSSLSTVVATRQLTSTGAGGYTLEFDVRVNGEGSGLYPYDFIKVFADSTLLQGAASTPTYSNGSYTGNGALKLGTTQYFYNYSVAGLTTTTAATAVRHLTATLPYEGVSGHVFNLMFMWRNDGSSGSQPPAAIDNISLVEIPCAAPSNVAVHNMTTTTADISWTAATDATAWRLYYKTTTDSTYDSIDVTTNPYTLTTLTSGTNYNLYIATNCSGTLSDVSNVITFATACDAVSTLPYTENFDSYTAGSSAASIPTCWTRINTYSSVFPYISSSYSSSASNSLYFYCSPTTYNLVSISPIDTTTNPMNTLQVSFKYKVGNVASKLIVGIMTDPTDATTFTAVDTVSNTSTTSWIYKEVPFSNYTGYGNYIALKNDGVASGTYPSCYVDDLTVDLIPACARPSQIIVSNITTTSADVSWTNGHATDNSWIIYYKQVSASTYDSVITSNNPYSFTTLNPSTTYSIYVVTDCGSGATSIASDVINFNTICGAITTLPYSENFDSYASSTFMNCWSRPVTYNNYPMVYTSYPHSGSNCLDFHAESATNPSYAVTPQIGVNIHDVQISFWGRPESYSSSGTMELGVMSNPNDTSTFELVQAITPTNNTYTQYTFDFSGTALQGDTLYIAFRDKTNASYWYWFIDDIVIDSIPACSRPVANSVRVANIASTSADILWSDHNAAHTAWNVYYRQLGSTDAFSSMAASDTTTTLTGLTPNTYYEVAVRTDCGSGLESDSTYIVTFLTGQTPANVPYTTSFNTTDDNDMWTILRGSGTNRWVIGTGTNNSDDATSGALYVTNDTANTYAASAVYGFMYTYRDIDFGTTPTSYDFTFDYKVKGYISGTSVSAGICVFLVDTNDAIPTGGFPSYVNDQTKRKALLYGDTTWTQEQIALDTVSGLKRVLFLTWGYSATGATTVPAAIDNINIAVSTCPRPTAVTASNITTTSADLSWTGSASGYLIRYRAVSDTVLYYQNATGNTSTITGLTSATQYVVWVASLCGSDTSLYSDYALFRTPCSDGAITSFPWTEGFENGLDCWNQTNVSGSASWAINGAYSGHYTAPEGSNFAGIYSTSDAVTRLESPVLDISSLTTPYLIFKHVQSAWGSDQDTLGVYYRTDTSSAWTYLTSFSNSITSWQTDSVALPSGSATYQIGFLGYVTYGYGVGIDSVSVYDPNGSYVTPPIVATTSATNIAQTSAVLNGTVTAGTNPVTAQGFEWKATTGGTYTTIAGTLSGTTLSATLSGLTANTSYTYRAFATTSTGNTYGSEITFTTIADTTSIVTPPAVTTDSATVAATSAVLSGTVTAGTHAITAQGFQWKATNGGTYATVNGTISGTTLSATITNLTAATGYTYRAFATTADTTVYGVEKTFTTLNSIADVNGNEFSVKLYPNPTEGDATLSVEGLNEEATVIMTDVQGRVISSEKIAAGQKTFTIRRNNISSGVYYIRVITNEAIKIEKLIVK